MAQSSCRMHSVFRAERVLESLHSGDLVLNMVNPEGENSDGGRAEEDEELKPKFGMPRRFFSFYLVETSKTALPLAMSQPEVLVSILPLEARVSTPQLLVGPLLGFNMALFQPPNLLSVAEPTAPASLTANHSATVWERAQPYSYGFYASDIPTTSRVLSRALVATSLIIATNDLDCIRNQVFELDIKLALRKAWPRGLLFLQDRSSTSSS